MFFYYSAKYLENKESFMTRTKSLNLFVIVSMILSLSANVAFAASKTDKHEKEVKRTMLKFVGLAATAGVLQYGAGKAGLAASTKAMLQLSNVMIQGGVISGQPVLTDLGLRALIVGGSVKAANTDVIAKSLLPNLPFIGPHIRDAGAMGVSLTTVAFYELAKFGYIEIVDSLPPSAQSFVRGE
jgi:hypothetical protein